MIPQGQLRVTVHTPLPHPGLKAPGGWRQRLGNFGRIPGPLNPGQSTMVTGKAAIPSVIPGTYHVIVRTDVFNQIPETNENNNLGVSVGTFEVSAIPLALGMPFEGTMTNGQEHYFALDVPEGETIRIQLDHSNANAWTELYVRYGDVPTLGQFDFLFDAQAQPDQEITIPTTQAGRYYVLARASGGVSEPGVVFNLLAEVVPFSITSVNPGRVGNGKVTLRLQGSRWTSETVFQIRNSATRQEIEALKNDVKSATEARALFDLSGVSLGQYDVVAVSPVETAVAPAALTVETASKLMIDYKVSEGPAIRRGTSGKRFFTAINRSNVDILFLTVQIATGLDESIHIYTSAVGEPLMDAPSQNLKGAEFLFPDVASGEQVSLPLTIKVERAYAYNELLIFVYTRVYTHDEYRDGPLSLQTDIFLYSILTNPNLDTNTATLLGQNFVVMSKQLFDIYELDVPQESESPQRK